MAMNLEEFRKYMNATALQRQEAMLKKADAEVNGSAEHYKAWSQEIENHPIGKLGTRGLVGCCFID